MIKLVVKESQMLRLLEGTGLGPMDVMEWLMERGGDLRFEFEPTFSGLGSKYRIFIPDENTYMLFKLTWGKV